MSKFKIIECPRDAMQSVKMFIPTEKKIKYIQSLIGVGFDTLDMGSFVSQKAIPQLKDTADVLNSLDLSMSKTKLLVIVANIRGAESAAKFNKTSNSNKIVKYINVIVLLIISILILFTENNLTLE